MRQLSLLLLLLLPLAGFAQSGEKPGHGNRLAYLDELDPYYPHGQFPKLITPQWVGEPDVEAVVILAIDDMKEPKRYESFLRPILNRLKKIDGRAPVSIMTCNINPQDPQLQAWLKEGLSLEVHTVDHPCPFFKIGFAKAKDTCDRCVDLMHEIPHSKPVCFRMPCCDSLNTPSPRHWAEIFNKTTVKGNYLSLDSSVFMVYTSADPELPKELVRDDTGNERFKKYLPMDRDFVNWIENYPYPYLIGKYCWQFPCMTPSDWEAQHLHKSNNPLTVRDWKTALDCTVIKKGVFNMVFHPHGWIKAEQIIELIDHAVEKHGKKVKFLTFKEAHDRLQKSLFARSEWRNVANDIHLLDVNNDGYMDLVDMRRDQMKTRLWQPAQQTWKTIDLPKNLPWPVLAGGRYHFGILQKSGHASLACRLPSLPMGIDRVYQRLYHFDGEKWHADDKMTTTFLQRGSKNTPLFHRLIDLDGDGICEMIDADGGVFSYQPGIDWRPLPFRLAPALHGNQPFGQPYDTGVRLLDLNGDRKLDLIFANEKEFGVYLFTDMEKGWSKKLRAGKTGDPDALPMISRNGTINGCFLHSGQLWWANEDTHFLKNHVDRRSFKQLLQGK